MTAHSPSRLEAHEHAYIKGKRVNKSGAGWPPGVGSNFEHSHPDGNAGHSHPETGPGRYTIDKDDWYAATGLRGGGRKKFTKRPSGEQLPFVARTPEEQTFLVVFCDTGFSAEHERAGVTLAEYERTRDDFKAATAGQIPSIGPDEPGEGGAAVANVALSFGMTPVYRYEGPGRRRGGAT